MIKLEKISVSFGENKVIHDFCFNFPDSGVFCLNAPSGAGKTTLLRVILGLQKPDKGQISGAEGKKLSVVFQEDRLFESKNALKNVSLVSNEKIAAELLKKFEFSDEDMLKKPSALSGGMNRRVALARAVAYGGEVLIMDEPFKGLDSELKKKIIPLVLDSGFKLIIFTTHDSEETALMGAKIINL